MLDLRKIIYKNKRVTSLKGACLLKERGVVKGELDKNAAREIFKKWISSVLQNENSITFNWEGIEKSFKRCSR